MKEFCRNSDCMENESQQSGASRTFSATPAALSPDTSMGDCGACVRERIGLAEAYVPSQPYEAPMEQEQSLVCGTAFAELVIPYCQGWNIYRFGGEE